ncbi:MAG: CYTH domain-containing protein, partial [bacterium]|nr:CYTH domain-containing protein [bacterium]
MTEAAGTEKVTGRRTDMGTEIERKFLVQGEGWRQGAVGTDLQQGYLSVDPDRTVRVRLAGDQGTLTIKGRPQGIERREFEYPIPAGDAVVLLQELCLRPLIEKTRYRVQAAGRVWEVDQFAGANEGLVLAEIELQSPDVDVELPEWVGA